MYVLIDFGATYSFIAYGMVKRLQLEPTLVDHISSEMPDRDNVLSNQILLDEAVILKG